MKLKVEILKDIVRFIFWYPLRWVLPYISRRFALRIISLIGPALAIFLRSRQRVIFSEYKALFPEKNEIELRKIARAAIVHFLLDELDVLYYPMLTAEILQRNSHIYGEEHLKSALEKGRGVILLLCHLGTNQFLMPALGFRGYRIGQVSLPADAVEVVFGNQKISPLHRKVLSLKRKMEESLPSRHIFMNEGIWESLDWLRQGNILAIAADGRHGSHFFSAPFNGRSITYSPGAFVIGIRGKAPILPVFILRKPDISQFDVIIEPRLRFNGSLRKMEQINSLIRQYNERMLYYFNKFPAEYGMFIYLSKVHTSDKVNALFEEWK